MAWFAHRLSEYKVRDLPLPQEVITLQHPHHTLFDAIKILAEHHLLSAPVLDSSGELLGLLDTLTIVTYVVHVAAAGGEGLPNCDLRYLVKQVATLNLDDSLDKIGDSVAGPSRRAIVLGEDGVPYSVVTQSTLLQFLHQKRNDIFGLKHGGSAKDFCSAGVFTINETKTAMTAFETMNRLQISSLAIVGEDGFMLTVVSTSDLVVGLAKMEDKSSAIERLKQCNVVEFALAHRRPELRDRATTIAVSPTQSLQEVIEKLALARVHRVIVMDEDRKPMGVVSLSDICRIVCELQKGRKRTHSEKD